MRIRPLRRALAIAALATALAPLGSCGRAGVPPTIAADAWRSPEAEAFLDTLQHRTFLWFWDLGDSVRGLTHDRWPTRSFASSAAMGFALTAYPIGVEHGWVDREAARARVLTTLRFLWTAPQDSTPRATGYRGFFYHFLEPATGRRFADVELSTVDTGLLLAGALFCQSYFDRDEPGDAEVRALAESLACRVDWTWAQVRPPLIGHGWTPEGGHLPYDWGGYSEAMIMNLIALGSPTHPVGPETWEAWTAGYRWRAFEGPEHVGFAPLFGHQYSHAWVDFRGIQDAYMRKKGIDYFENARRATLAQRTYAIRNPGGWTGYGPDTWGLTACDGPHDTTLVIAGRRREFRTYAARGASFTEIVDDGTIAPTAAGGSVAFAPEIAVPALMHMRSRYGEPLWGAYGFLDAFNPTLTEPMPLRHGRIVPGVGWFDTDYLGIDQGPILVMVENLRTGLVWERMKRNPHLVRGLRRAGFTGGWLDRAPATP